MIMMRLCVFVIVMMVMVMLPTMVVGLGHRNWGGVYLLFLRPFRRLFDDELVRRCSSQSTEKFVSAGVTHGWRQRYAEDCGMKGFFIGKVFVEILLILLYCVYYVANLMCCCHTEEKNKSHNTFRQLGHNNIYFLIVAFPLVKGYAVVAVRVI